MIPTRKIGLGAVVLGTVIAGGLTLASLNSASAASATTTAASSAVVDDSGTAATDSSATSADAAPAGPHTANGITETVQTGDVASSIQAAVLAAYPDATINRIETDADGAVYEAHVTLADGSDATVKLNASFAITGTETGGPGGRGGGGPHSANGITETALTGDTAASVQAAVVAAHPDATIDRMETDADGGVYEAHITLADGSKSTVTLDAAFAITGTQTGNG